MRQVRLLTMAAVALALVTIGMPGLLARQVAPGAPTNLAFTVSPGGGLTLQWTHSTGTFTHYIIEAAPGPGAPAFLRVPTSAYANGSGTTPGYYGQLPDLVASFSATGIGQGDYYVRILGANGAAESGPSNEIRLPVRAGCFPPAAPTNFTQIVRGTTGFLMWNPGSGGAATAYIVRASFGPNDPNPPVQIPLGTTAFTLAIPAGTFYVNIVAVNGCGSSAPSNELVITSPAQTPARTPDPPAGQRLPQPDVSGLVQQWGAEAAAQGLLQTSSSCPQRPGSFFDPIEARKTIPNPFINYIVDRLRSIDQRFGYNGKPTRAWVPAIIAGDEIAYHYGSDAPEGSPNTYAVDVLLAHCSGAISGDRPREGVGYRPFYGEFVRWTGAGRF